LGYVPSIRRAGQRLDGGLPAWQSAGYPVDTGDPVTEAER